MKNRLRTFLVLALFAFPNFSSAVTISELQIQLQALLAQLSALQSQSTTSAAFQGGGTAPSASCPNLIRNLSRSSRGEDVRQLQSFLISQELLAADLTTGYFGAMTEQAIKQLQCRNMALCSGSPSTNGHGAVGPRTRATIISMCAAPTTTPVTPTTPASSTVTVVPANTTTPTIPTMPITLPVVASCTPLPSQTQILSCPSGQTGSITQSRTSVCTTGVTAPAWSEWSTISNTCVVPPSTVPTVLTKYPNFTNICERRVIDYQNGTNILSATPAGCTWPNNPILFSVTHESALNTHWRLAADGTKIYDDNFVGDSAVYMHDYRDSDLDVIFRHNFVPITGGNGTHVLGMALDTINFPGTNVTGRDFRDGYLFMGIADLSISKPLLSISKPLLSNNIYVNVTFRIRGDNLVPYQGAASGHRLTLGAKLIWSEIGRANTAHFFEINLFKSHGFHAVQTQYPCPSDDGLTYDYCAYDSSAAGLYAEVKYIPITSVSGYQSLSTIATDTWYTVRIPLSSLVRSASWFSPPQSWDSAIFSGLYMGIESKGASRLWVEIKDYTVMEE